ncbi:hypothetical protein D5400_20430 [Georhizobium profundi]|jgi:2,3-dihydroxy-p-cumate/2,3-dihydroxybenzoate 3,4-dioxygenase|uniref:VOC domain-containing protein n=1 Tax=Georhizobium profundi TaxID=2341112 RepID=A0A3S9B8V8_9HYPH|nr:VOC family protein [Georhizobium profundi]AZN73339.1 hypothetical protein D5400_20430 [Georhizobium profundi]
MSQDAAIAYLRFGTAMTKVHDLFAADVIGLQRIDGDENEAWFRSDLQRRTLVFFKGERESSVVGIALFDAAALEAVAQRLSDAYHPFAFLERSECDRLFVRSGLRTQDPSGNLIDLVVGPHHSGRRFFPRRDNGIQGVQSIGIRSLDTQRDLTFWCDLLGFTVRDHVGDIAYIGIGQLHHRLVLYPSARAGVLSVNFAVEDVELIMQNKYFFEAGQVRIVLGPGRDAASGQVFVTIEGPEGLLYRLVTDTTVIDPARHRPRQFAAVANSLCAWGSQPQGVPEYEFENTVGLAPLELVKRREGSAR